MSFTINARYVLLTYAQSAGLDGWAVMDHISTLGGECIVAREDHADGGTHLHVFCDFGRKFRSRKADIFDVDHHHPNIEPSKGTPEKGYDYAIKDGDVICGGLGRPNASRTRDSNAHSRWTEITSAENREQFWELVHSLDPKVQRALLRNSQSTVTGNSQFVLPIIHRQADLNSLMGLLMDDLIGYTNLAWEVDNHT